jgi:hypothetical protein
LRERALPAYNERMGSVHVSLGFALGLALWACGEDPPAPVSAGKRVERRVDHDGGAAGRGADHDGGGHVVPPPPRASDAGLKSGAPVDDATLLSDLDADGIAATCDEIGAAVLATLPEAELAELSCTVIALLFAATTDASGTTVVDLHECETVVADCVDNGEATSSSSCDAEGLASAAARCDREVGEFRACMLNSVRVLSDAIDLLSCENLARAGGAEEALDSEALDPLAAPECASIAVECPELFGP